MDKDNIIDLLTFYKFFQLERSVLEAKQNNKDWEQCRQQVITWLSKKSII